jgi:hypothetical protein
MEEGGGEEEEDDSLPFLLTPIDDEEAGNE